MATTLTQTQLITYAGQKAGNEAIPVLTLKDWLNNIIDSLGRAVKWPEFQKIASATLASAGSTFNLPADYEDLWDENSLRLETATTSTTLIIRDPEWRSLCLGLTGAPKWAIIDMVNRVVTVYPAADQSYTYKLLYRMKPSRLATDATIPFGNDDIFIQSLYVQILQYESDDRYTAEAAILTKLIEAYLDIYNTGPIFYKSKVPLRRVQIAVAPYKV